MAIDCTRTLTALYTTLFLVGAVVGTAPVRAQEMTSDPEQVRLVVDDLRRLSRVLDTATSQDSLAEILDREYLAHASPGLRAYAERYELTPQRLASAVADHPAAYDDLDGLTKAILAHEEELRAGFRRLRELVPDAVFPPVWLIAGFYGPGGLTRREGVIVAAERYTERLGEIVPIVLHELAHFQQARVQGVERYRRIYGPEQTLLALALREGTAELVAELTTGRHINPAAERFGLAHERTLWQQFRTDMHHREPGEWMFVQPSSSDRPPDLGYWVGYRIAKLYFEQADDRQQALHDLLAMEDVEAVLEKSGYANRFED